MSEKKLGKEVKGGEAQQGGLLLCLEEQEGNLSD